MSDINNSLAKGTFDLRATLAGRNLPEETVEFYIDEDLGHSVENILSHIETLHNQLAVANLGSDEELKKKIDGAVSDAEELLEKTRKEIRPYHAVIRATTRRARYDLQSKAIHQYPIKRDVFGNDDPNNEFERNRYVDQLIWASHLRSIQSPDGETQTFTYPDDIEVIQGIMDDIPETAYRTINKAIDKLMDDGNQFEFAAQSEDFSSGS